MLGNLQSSRARRVVSAFFAAVFLNISSRAQTACDSLDIKVSYAAFHDSLVSVSVTNSSSGFFSYPAFVLYNGNGDTVAKEDPNLFGIGPASSHILNLYTGMPQNNSFNGTLELYTNFFDSLNCSYQQIFTLCPDSLLPLIVFLGNSGGATTTGTVLFEIINTTTQGVSTGILELTSSNQHDEDTVWIAPGNYMLQLNQINLTPGGQKSYGLKTEEYSQMGLGWTYNSTTDTTMLFSFFGKCSLPTSVNTIASSAPITVSVYQNKLTVVSPDNHRIEKLALFSTDGKVVKLATGNTTSLVVDLNDLVPGLYIVQALHAGRISSRKILVQ